MFLVNMRQNQNYLANFYNDSILGMIGLFDPNETMFKVLLCPEMKELQGNTYPCAASPDNIERAKRYAEESHKEYKDVIDGMRISCQMAAIDKNAALPKMFFYIPSAQFADDQIIINFNSFGCRCPKDDNTNVKFPIDGYAPCEVFVIDIERSKKGRRGPYDQISYFINKENPNILEGYLSDPVLSEKFAEEVRYNPLLECFAGNSEINVEDMYNIRPAIKIHFCLKDHPEVIVYANVLSLYDSKDGQIISSAEGISDYITKNIEYLAKSVGKDIDEDFIKNNIYVRAVSGYHLKDMLFDHSDAKYEITKRLQAEIEDRCSYISNGICVPPLKRVVGEEKRLLHTVRSLTLLAERKNPTNAEDEEVLVFPKGYGLASLRFKPIKKDSEEIIPVIQLEAGFLSHTTDPTKSAFNFNDTKFNLNDMGIPLEKALGLFFEKPDDALRKIAEKYAK